MIRPKQIIRSKRKTIALVVNNQAELIVRAPFIVSDEVINKLVESKQTWIKNKQDIIKINTEKHIDKLYKDGECLLFFGNDYILDFVKTDCVKLDKKRLLVPAQYEGKAKEIVLDWYKEQAYKEFKSRLDFYANKIGAIYNEFNLSDAHARWGSCSTKQSINLNWRLIMCPQFVIDYVVIHELSHIQFKNHSKEFWSRVNTIMPNYKEAETWLNDNIGLISIK